MPTVKELIEQCQFPPTWEERRRVVGIYGRDRGYGTHSATESDHGFGWIALHLTQNGGVSGGGVYNSKRAAWAFKRCAPFTVDIVVWDKDRMVRALKAHWSRYTQEEKDDINQVMAGYGYGPVGERKLSSFAKWVESAEKTPVATDEQLCDAVMGADRDTSRGGQWPFPV